MFDWQKFKDGETINLATQKKLMAKWRARESTTFKEEVRYFDFDSHGKPFTQVALILTPEKPLMVDGRRVVVFHSEGGHDNGIEFMRDYDGNEGCGPWLARRGVTFIQLCRLGRWNFLSKHPYGSWIDVPLGERMPMFHRGQREHWGTDQYVVTGADGVSSPTGSQRCRVARPGSALEEHMMALTPVTSITGFELAIKGSIDLALRGEMLLFYSGFSTGGPFLWSLSRRIAPNGMLGYGTANFPIAYYFSQASAGEYRWLYDRSTFRVRERGITDFAFFTGALSDAQRQEQFKVALHSPRFKSHEDTFMFFNVAAQCEALSRLWNAKFLPESVRARGFSALIQDNLDLAFPGPFLGGVSVLDVFGAEDEILPPPTVSGPANSVVRQYCRRYTTALLEGRHHCIDAEHSEAFGSLWLDAIEAGYFHRDA
jgi:hypothetical protein